eukprot:TRINITY_DN27055_c0_g1_i1.p1 TRINITY_DN27055_c0_g1~~TRINITY_DN27055_c0_g1_i1.p1  ORF type:complete len:320 (-),score=65.81 TRINITY_DN27055_c0_g1_i1:8-847(-)
MESREDCAFRARRRLNAAKAFRGYSWEEVFSRVDPRRIGQLTVADLRGVVRNSLGISERTVCEHDLRMLFSVMDKDGSNSVDLSELMDYLAQGTKRKVDEEAQAEVKLRRAHRNLRLALNNSIPAGHQDMRQVFENADLDDDNRMSLYEWQQFVRGTLKLTIWDLSNSDMDSVYAFLNKSGEGLTLQDLVRFVKAVDGDGKSKEFTFYDAPERKANFVSRRKTLTYRQQLEGEAAERLLPSLRSSTSFVSLGRVKPPKYRAALSTGAIRFFEPEKYGVY